MRIDFIGKNWASRPRQLADLPTGDFTTGQGGAKERRANRKREQTILQCDNPAGLLRGTVLPDRWVLRFVAVVQLHYSGKVDIQTFR